MLLYKQQVPQVKLYPISVSPIRLRCLEVSRVHEQSNNKKVQRASDYLSKSHTANNVTNQPTFKMALSKSRLIILRILNIS